MSLALVEAVPGRVLVLGGHPKGTARSGRWLLNGDGQTPRAGAGCLAIPIDLGMESQPSLFHPLDHNKVRAWVTPQKNRFHLYDITQQLQVFPNTLCL